MSADRWNGIGDELPAPYTDDFNTRADAAVDAMAETLPANFVPSWVHKPMTYAQLRAISEAEVAKLYEPTRGEDVDTTTVQILRMGARQAR